MKGKFLSPGSKIMLCTDIGICVKYIHVAL